MRYTLVQIDKDNYKQHTQFICYINPKNASYHLKVDWFLQRLEEGLTIRLLYPEGEKKPQGFIEYVPGEYAWRGVSAAGYMLIHCIWIYSNAWKNRGIGTALLQECCQDATAKGMNGVAVLSGADSFLAKPTIFTKNGFAEVETAATGHVLLAKQLKSGALPRLNDWQSELMKYQGWHIVYTRQCPWVARFVSELDDFLKEKGVALTITELTTPAQAQHAPSPYATFNLIHDGKLLADHYISMTRFGNILMKAKAL